MNGSFFGEFVEKVILIINTKIGMNAIFEVKHLRKILNISSKDRSKTIFLANALDLLSRKGLILFISKNSPKRYKKIQQIGKI